MINAPFIHKHCKGSHVMYWKSERKGWWRFESLFHLYVLKVTRAKSIFPSGEALKKMLSLAYRDISKKWRTMPLQNWGIVLSNLSIIIADRLNDVL